MRKEIWKYVLDADNKTTFNMPEKAEILTVQSQNETACIWALVNPLNNKEERIFEVVATGEPFEHKATEQTYIGTFQLYYGTLVFHLFEIIAKQ